MKKRKPVTKWAMEIAEINKEKSTCLSRQVGAVILQENQIISTGYNGAPKGCIHCTDIGYCERKKRGFESGCGLEICRSGHAESNAIDQCAKKGTSCEGATLYVTTQPCVFCSIRIIQSGIKKVVFKGSYPTGLAMVLLKEALIETVTYEEELKKEELKILEKLKKEQIRLNEFLKKEKTY